MKTIYKKGLSTNIRINHFSASYNNSFRGYSSRSNFIDSDESKWLRGYQASYIKQLVTLYYFVDNVHRNIIHKGWKYCHSRFSRYNFYGASVIPL